MMLAGTFAVAALSEAVQAGPPWRVDDGFPTNWATLSVTTREVAPHLYFLHASGGNSLALTGPDGIVLVDPELAPAAPKLSEALDALHSGPVRYAIDTHFHPDHSGGNAFFHRRGAVIIAQQNVTARLAQSRYSPYWGTTTPAAPPEALPEISYDREMELHVNGETITLLHWDNVHTDGDTVVYFRNADVVHMGDIFLTQLYPYIDVPSKGTIDGYVPLLDKVLAMIGPHTVVIPGHGAPSDRAGLQRWRNMIATVRNRVAAEVAQGRTLEQIIDTRPTREFDEEWASNREGPADFVALIYQSLTGKRLDWRQQAP